MAKTLTIAGNDFKPKQVTGSAIITERVQNKSNTLNCRMKIKEGETTPQEGSEFVYKDGARFLFGGIISRTRPTETGIGHSFMYELEVTDYTYILNSKVAKRSYTNQTMKAIITDLMSAYVDAGYGFTITNVQTGPVIPSITFNHISIRKCFEKISKRTGYVWWVDYQKNLYFQTAQTDIAPETITDAAPDNHEWVQIVYDTTQVRNRVTVIGSRSSEETEDPVTETFTGDGATKTFVLKEKPSTMVSIKLNGVAQTFAVDNINDETGNYFMWSYAEQYIRVVTAETEPTGSDTIEVTYYHYAPVIAERESAASIAQLVTLEGGDGVHEYTLEESNISTKAEAQDRGDQEVEDFGFALVDGRAMCRSDQLQPGSYFQPGQILTVNLPSWGITTDTAFLVQELVITIDENDTETIYNYEVRFGGKQVTVERFLETLANPETSVADADLILTIEKANDSMAFTDLSTATETFFTPPFKVGPTGSPIAVVNKSEVS